jgi:HD-GYP domain-containing protein (c-di-GMP phosphodiesterase class II)
MPAPTDVITPLQSSQAIGSTPTEFRLSEAVAALSYALDITEGQPQGHAARSCLIGMRLARQIALTSSEQSALFYALLLKDLGCSSNAAKMCYLFGADDRTIKRDAKKIDWERMTENVKFAARQVAPDGSTLERMMRMVAMALQGPKGGHKLIETRCERGAAIARRLGFPEETVAAIHQLDEHWNGHGHPEGRQGAGISLLARIACLAQTVEVFFSEFGLRAAVQVARDRRGRWFDPQLVDAFLKLEKDSDFWMEVKLENPHELVSQFEPPEEVRLVDEAMLDQLAQAFAEVVDAKSPWTYRHSTGVADIAVGMADVLGYSSDELRIVRRMGLLHDVGKLGVSNSILDKPARLTDEEFAVLKRHTYFTQGILGRVQGFSKHASVAAAHHEKLNGSGYHRGLVGDELSQTARVLCVADIFEAMSAARPYREAVPLEKVLTSMNEEAGQTICAESFVALQKWLDRTEFTNRVTDQLAAVERLVAEL